MPIPKYFARSAGAEPNRTQHTPPTTSTMHHNGTTRTTAHNVSWDDASSGIVERRSDDKKSVEEVIRLMYKKHMAAIRSPAATNAALSQGQDHGGRTSCGTKQSDLPPPSPLPPPSMVLKSKEASPHGTASTRSFDEENYVGSIAVRDRSINAEKRDAYILESGDEGFETMDLTEWPSHWSLFHLTGGDKVSGGGGPRRRRKKKMSRRFWFVSVFVLVLLFVIMVVGFSVGAASDKKEQNNQALSASSSNVRMPPTAAPTVKIAPAPIQVTEEDSAVEEGGPSSLPVPQEQYNNTFQEETGTMECKDSIESDLACYSKEPMFVINFRRCEPINQNWIGIYSTDNDQNPVLDAPLIWLWTCGQEKLKDCPKEGTISGSLGIPGTLEPGSYRAHFIEFDGNPPYESYLSSEIFQVSETC